MNFVNIYGSEFPFEEEYDDRPIDRVINSKTNFVTLKTTNVKQFEYFHKSSKQEEIGGHIKFIFGWIWSIFQWTSTPSRS